MKKFIRLYGEEPILSITITPPVQTPGYTYYYPEGRESGWGKGKKVYFLSRRSCYDDSQAETYYKDASEAASENENLFAREGKVWTYGTVAFEVKDQGREILMKYKESRELILLLDNLIDRWGISLDHYACLETPEVESLYEYKSKSSL